jgi:hypothetical protein
VSGFERTGSEIGAGVSVIVADAAPGGGPELHRHPYREVFVVLEGEATLTLGDEQLVLPRARQPSRLPTFHTASSTRAPGDCCRWTSTNIPGSRPSGSDNAAGPGDRAHKPVLDVPKGAGANGRTVEAEDVDFGGSS